MMERSDIVAGKWDGAHVINNYRNRFLENIPWAKKYIQELYLGGVSSFQILKSSLVEAPVARALELAGGRGDFTLAMVRGGVARNVHMVDLSEEAVSIASKKAADAGVDVVTTEVADVNKISISRTYDLIVFSQSLHHIAELEHVLGQVKGALSPGGVFYVADYIGPSRMQWSSLQLSCMNALLELIPENLRVMLNLDGTISKEVKRKIVKVPIDKYMEIDPSEAVRSDEIQGLIRQNFCDVSFHPLGGGLTYELFRNIAHNFVDNGECSKALLQTMIYTEYMLTMNKVIEPSFGLFVCRV